jgi:cytochrome c oxidase subunit IV
MNEHAAPHPTPRVYYIVFGALMALLLLTVVAAELELGQSALTRSRWNLLIAATIASTKAVLIILFFMHVRYSSPLVWLFSFAGFFWLAILFGLTFNDYWTRG